MACPDSKTVPEGLLDALALPSFLLLVLDSSPHLVSVVHDTSAVRLDCRFRDQDEAIDLVAEIGRDTFVGHGLDAHCKAVLVFERSVDAHDEVVVRIDAQEVIASLEWPPHSRTLQIGDRSCLRRDKAQPQIETLGVSAVVKVKGSVRGIQATPVKLVNLNVTKVASSRLQSLGGPGHFGRTNLADRLASRAMPSTNTLTFQRTTPRGRQCIAFVAAGPNALVPLEISTVFAMGPVTKEKIEKYYKEPEYEGAWAELDAGQYHPLMYRDYTDDPRRQRDLSAEEERRLIHAIEHAEILIEDLRDIARVVYPSPKTAKAYGARIRDLLMRACTEVEAQCKAVLKANNYVKLDSKGKKSKRDLDMSDYALVVEPLGLEVFTVEALRFPDYPKISPFKDWPETSLSWYQAYNRTKHNREEAFEDASLENAISAVAAVFVLLAAQYGWRRTSAIQDRFFGLVEVPDWEASERFYPPGPSGAYTSVDYPFAEQALREEVVTEETPSQPASLPLR